MKSVSFFKGIKITLAYCLPAFIACSLVLYDLHGRIESVGSKIKFDCANASQECQDMQASGCAIKDAEKKTNKEKTCLYRLDFYDVAHANIKAEVSSIFNLFSNREAQDELVKLCAENSSAMQCIDGKLSFDVDSKLFNIFGFNAVAVMIMVLLPFILTGNLLGTSNRINLAIQQRMSAATSNWWLKFVIGLIMAIGWIYILNPDGRGASTYYQFFIAAGIDNEETIPIFIKTKGMVPVIAGFFGWYLHLIGYTFTKLIHHDVISSRVYNLLFKKFIVVYGIALVLPAAGLVEDEKSYAFFMFAIGLFPLSAMSILIEAASKFGSGDKGNTASLSLLPGISRWQILRLEEEGVDSMASLANINIKTIRENLQFLEKLTAYWMDIAQLHTIVGLDAYTKIAEHCMTASEFVRNANDAEFAETIDRIEGVGTTKEIARLLIATFDNPAFKSPS